MTTAHVNNDINGVTKYARVCGELVPFVKNEDLTQYIKSNTDIDILGGTHEYGNYITLEPGITIGDDVSIGDNSKIEEHSLIGSCVFIGKNVTITEGMLIGDPHGILSIPDDFDTKGIPQSPFITEICKRGNVLLISKENNLFVRVNGKNYSFEDIMGMLPSAKHEDFFNAYNYALDYLKEQA